MNEIQGRLKWILGLAAAIGFGLWRLNAPTAANIPVNDYNDILRARSGADVRIEREGEGAVVLRGRQVRIHVSKSLVAGIIHIPEYTFIGGGDSNGPVSELAQRLTGYREGSILRFGAKSGMVDQTVEILQVCDGAFLSRLFTCRSLPPDKITSRLRNCEDFTNATCQEAAANVNKGPIRFESSAPFFVEYCILKNQNSCRLLLTYLMDSTPATGRQSGLRFDEIQQLKPYAGISDQEFLLQAAQSKSEYFQDWAEQELLKNLTPEGAKILFSVIDSGSPRANRLASDFAKGLLASNSNERAKFVAAAGGAGRDLPNSVQAILSLQRTAETRHKEVEKDLHPYAVDPNAFAVFYNRSDSLKRELLTEANLTKFNAGGYNLFMIAAIGDGINLLSEFCKNSSLLNLTNSRGETVLHFLAERNSWADMRNLILDCKGGLHLEVKDQNGKTPKDWAQERGFDRITELLTRAISETPL